jgi:predicted Zn-dependent peptidase
MFKRIDLIKAWTFAALALAAIATVPVTSRSQTAPYAAPRESRLLNGARLLVWYDAKAPKVSVSIRIHSGSAFDPLGKEGVMQLLSDILFPAETTKSFFEEDLNGSFEIVTNYDYIQINTSGDSDKFLSILETLSPAVINPVINKETTDQIKTPHLTRLAILEKDPEYVARRAALKSLFGSYPYGRSQLGTPESVSKIDFADLLAGKQRFLTADNSTIAIHGNVKPEFALRASKRLLGGWLKSDKKVPATFAAPNAPDAAEKKIEIESAPANAGVFAWRIGARNSRDYYASLVAESIWKDRSCMTGSQFHLLEGVGMFVRRFSPAEGEFAPMMRNTCNLYMADPAGKAAVPEIGASDFSSAKEKVETRMREALSSPKAFVNAALDIETYKLVSIADEQKKLSAVTLEDVKRVNSAWLKQPSAKVFVHGAVAK